MTKISSYELSITSDIQTYITAARRDLISACSNALKVGACIIAYANIRGGSVSAVIAELDLGDVSRRTLYRWANAYNTAVQILGLARTPDHGDKDWSDHLAALENIASNMSISRLQLGAPAEGSDIARLDTLQTAAETAANEAEESIYANALEQVEKGHWTLIQAMRAIGSQVSKEVAIERRKDPLYIGIDDETKKPVGILPKAISSLKTGFEYWDAFDGESKRAFAQLWREVQNVLPAELKRYI